MKAFQSAAAWLNNMRLLLLFCVGLMGASLASAQVPIATITVSPASASVAEDGAANLVYTVTLDQPASSATSVNYTIAGTAINGTDYATITSPLVIPAGSTTGTITVNPTVDGTVEADETVTLTIAAGAGYTVGAPASATGTILNDDVPTATIAVSPASVSEDGATNQAYTVTLNQAAFSATSVNYTIGGTAINGTDYATIASPLVIPAGSTTGTITINPTVDGTVEADETVTLTIGAGPGYTVGAPASATGTILNDDVPTATIAVSPVAVAEDGAPNLVYTVTLNQASFSALSIGYTIGGTATNGIDYATIASPLVIPAGNTTGNITVNPTADATIEADETVTLTINAGAGYTVGVPNAATGTILNDDLPNLTINDVTASEGNAGTTNFTFTVSLSAPAGPGGVTFDIATANGSATAGSDYVAQSLTSQTIPAGSSTYNFTVVVNGDTLNEASETFFVNVTNVTNAVVVDGQGVGTIINDDPLPSLSINDVNVLEGNSGTTNAVFTVTLSAASGQTVTVNYATANGTATQPADYTNTSGSLTFTPGQTTRTITVPVIGETVPEANETFFVNLSAATNATISDNQGVGTITNDDVPVTVSPATVPNGTVAAAYSQTLTASGGAGPYSFSVSAGALPAGLTLSPAGVLSGTPTAGGTFNFTVSATDSSPFPGPFSGSQAYTLTIAPPTISLPATALVGGTLGSAYSASITAASGGTAPYGYAVTAGALPGGLTLNASTGAITGTPSALGTFNFSVTATDSSTGTGPYTATQSYAITVVAAPPVANSSSFTVGYGAAATNVPLNITGGTPTSVAIGSAPTHGTALVSGTTITYQPAAGYAGPDSFTYTATNSGGTSTSATVSISVNDAVITIIASGGFSAAVGASYTQTFTFNGGATPWSGYQVTNLPAGLSITGTTTNSVTVSGTPTQAGSFNLNVSATDSSTGSGPYTVGQAFTLTVSAPTLSMTPAPGTLSAPYATAFSQSFTASGGIGPYSYALTGTLPAGLSFSSNTLSGTPTAPGSYPITVTATDTGAAGTGAPFSVAQNYTIDVPAPTIVVNPTALPAATAGTAYSQNLTATGGSAPHTFALSAGSLPSGLTLTSAGVLSGTATASGTFNFTAVATDNHGQTGSRLYSLVVNVPGIAILPTSVSSVAAGTAYSQTFTVTGGITPITVALTGILPAGVTFNAATHTLSGTPSAAGTFNFSLTATDSTGGTPATVTNNYSLVVTVPTLLLAPASLPAGTGGTAYSQTLVASGGIAPYTYALTAGALPAGLSLSSAGVLSGTPTVAGTFNVSVRVTDTTAGTAATVTNNYSLVINAPTIALAPTALPSGSNGAVYNQPLSASGGTAPYTFALSAGALPPGLTLSAAGIISGTPTATGSFNFTITGTDNLGFTGTHAYTFVIVSAPPVANGDTATTIGTTPVLIPVTANDSGVFTSIAIAAAPASGTATVSALNVTYTANSGFSGTDSFTYTLIGPGGSVTATVTVTVNPVPVALSQTLDAIAGIPIVVDLTQGATGGPFTAATLVSVTPAGSGTAAIAATYQLTYTPAAAFSGTATVVFTLSNAFATSAQANITFNVTARPDPSKDPEVRALLETQVDATRRFAGAQINNFMQRLERLHGADALGDQFSNNLSFALPPQPCTERAGARPGVKCNNNALLGADDAATMRPRMALKASAAPDDQRRQSAFGLWAGGIIRSGNLDGRGTGASIDFESDGISIGGDYRITPSFTFGAGLGFGRDASEVGDRESESDGTAYTAALYASYHPSDKFFIDGMIGYQWLDFDLRRTVTTNGNRVRGDRTGEQPFVSLTAGANIQREAWQFTPYGRIEYSKGMLGGYTERGDALFALTYDSMNVEASTASVGLRVDYSVRTKWGMFVPQLRIEQQHDFKDDATAVMRYSDLLGPVFRSELEGFDRNRTSLGIGAVFNANTDWAMRIEYRGQVSGSDRDNSVTVNVEKRF